MSAPEEAFEKSPAMHVAASMGMFGPSAQQRAYEHMQPQLDMSDAEQKAVMKGLLEKDVTKATVHNYLQAVEVFRRSIHQYEDLQTKAVSAEDKAALEHRCQSNTKLWARLRQARIFSMNAQTYAMTHHLADRFSSEVIAGVPWRSMTDPKAPDDEVRKVGQMYLDLEGDRFWMEHLPFETMWIGFGAGVAMNPLWKEVRGLSEQFPRHNDVAILGLLISEADKTVWEVSLGIAPDGRTAHSHIELCSEGEWEHAWTLGRFVVPMLVDLINENRTLILERRPSFSDRRDWKKTGKKMRVKQFYPRPYYTVKLQQKVIDESLRKIAKARVRKERVLTHRHDVRGHECCKVQRGTLPIDPKEEKKLLKRGYRIYTRREDITPGDYARLTERGVSVLTQGDWLAIKSWWRDPFVRGPADAPYIPAVRTLGKKPGGRKSA